MLRREGHTLKLRTTNLMEFHPNGGRQGPSIMLPYQKHGILEEANHNVYAVVRWGGGGAHLYCLVIPQTYRT